MGCKNSKLIILTVELDAKFCSQSQVTIKILDDQKVKEIEERLQDYILDRYDQACVQFQLTWNEKNLSSNAQLFEYDLPEKTQISANVRYLGELLILKLDVDGKEVKLKIHQNQCIGLLFKTVESLFKRGFQLYYKDQELEEKYTLANYGITDQSEIKLQWEGQKQNFICWSSKKTGVILRGTCQNPNCQAFQQQIINNLGFGIFCVSKFAEQIECPLCNEKADFIAFGFQNCQYLISSELTQCQDEIYKFKIARKLK